jgi:thioredoxin 1
MFWKKKAKKHYTAHITDQNFQEVVAHSELPVLVDFWSGGCGPCKVIGPIIDELAEEFDGRALIAKVNAAENPNLSAYFKVRSVPTLMFIKNGQLIERFSGLVPKPNLSEMIEDLIALEVAPRPEAQAQSEEEE